MHGPRVEQFGATENHFEDVGFAKIEVANRLDGIGQIDSIGISHRSPKQNRRTIGARIAAKFANKASAATLNRATGVVLTILGAAILVVNLVK